NWHEDARDADLVIFKAVVSGVQVRVAFEADLRTQFLRPSCLKIVLRVCPDIADALARVDSVVATKASQQRILERRRREGSVVGRVNDGFRLFDVVCQTYARA